MDQIELSDRQREILELTETQGFVTIDQLSTLFQVSAQTVRRDIIALDQSGLLQRFHGGAGSMPANEALRLGHERKATIDIDEKRIIAERTADLVPDESALYIDVGTTMETAALALNERQGLTVFTNSLRVALQFDHERHDIHVLGGQLRGRDGSLTGETAALALSELSLDFALIGCSGIEAGRRVMDFDPGKVAIKKTAMRVAARSFLLATEAKFQLTARHEVARLEDFTAVLSGTDDTPLLKVSGQRRRS